MSCVDFLTTHDFQVNIDKMPNVNLMAQTFMIPGITGATVKQPTPLNPVNRAYDHVEFDHFQLGVILTADADSYLKVFEWMMGIGFPVTNEQRTQFQLDMSSNPMHTRLTSDISVSLINAQKKPFMTFVFRESFPVSLDGVQLNKQQMMSRPLVCNMSFAYDSIDIRRVT